MGAQEIEALVARTAIVRPAFQGLAQQPGGASQASNPFGGPFAHPHRSLMAARILTRRAGAIGGTLACLRTAACTPSMIGPGGGGTTEVVYVPSSVRPIELQLDVTVWGAGDPVAGRYRDLRLHYTIGGKPPEQSVPGRSAYRDRQRERLAFAVLP